MLFGLKKCHELGVNLEGYGRVSAAVFVEGVLVCSFSIALVVGFRGEYGALEAEGFLKLTVEFPPCKHDVLGVADYNFV